MNNSLKSKRKDKSKLKSMQSVSNHKLLLSNEKKLLFGNHSRSSDTFFRCNNCSLKIQFEDCFIGFVDKKPIAFCGFCYHELEFGAKKNKELQDYIKECEEGKI